MPEIRMLNLTDITAPSGEVCGPDGCEPASSAFDPAAVDLGAAREIALESPLPAVTAAFGVTGMTCGHCVSAVTKELGALPGVDSVDVELVAGGVSTVTVGSDEAIGEDTIRAAIEEAGYALV